MAVSFPAITVSDLNPTRPRKALTLPCKSNNNATAFVEQKSASVDYDRGHHKVWTRLSGLRKEDIPKHHRLKAGADRFQKDWAVSEVVDLVLRLNRWEDIDGLLNHWIGRFARKNYPYLIKGLADKGAIEHSVQVFNWMKNQKNYCARTDIYNMMIRLHVRQS